MQFLRSKACQTDSHNALMPDDESMPCSAIMSLLAPDGVTVPLRLARENDKNKLRQQQQHECESTFV